MALIGLSLLFGISGAVLGALFGQELFIFIFAAIGIISPGLYVLEKIYKDKKEDNKSDYDALNMAEELRSQGIFSDAEIQKAAERLNKEKEEKKNKIKYKKSVDILYALSKESGITEAEYQEKISKLKSIYKQ